MDKMNDEFLGIRYDLVVWKTVGDYGNHPSPHTIATFNTKKVRNLELININGLGTGQAHFKDENGAYVIYPWCAIITMEPTTSDLKSDTVSMRRSLDIS